ncbi:hypothetical protein AnigIFM60653_001465 [Aspergillus niger]|nr:hypothetical protein AnigIFM60653_001465 [Aspergillus niger]
MSLVDPYTRSGSLWEALGLLALVTAVSIVTYRLYLHPLRHIPGPLLGRTSSLFLYTISYLGIEGRILRHYHRKYQTDVLRIAPDSVSISDPTAIRPIYIAGGGFAKDQRYRNFNLGEVVTIFSSLDTDYRDVRAKAVAPLFSPSRLHVACAPGGIIHRSVTEFVAQLQAFRADCQAHTQQHDGGSSSTTTKLDILDLCARLSLDVVTGYLLTEPYGGLTEHAHLPLTQRRATKLSINPFIFAIVGFSRFSLLPHWLFGILYALSQRLHFSEAVGECMGRMNVFAQRLVQRTVATTAPVPRMDSYQARLLAAGIDPAEVSIQCQAIVFAGADSTAVKLATILFHLVRNPQWVQRVREELLSVSGGSDHNSTDTNAAVVVDQQALPVLRAVIKEGLRLGMANPTRMTRVVPEQGLRVGQVWVPPGTIVGVAPYVVHHDPTVFVDPFSFRPERWLPEGEEKGLKTPLMDRSLLMFGVGARACIGKNLAMQQLLESVKAVVESQVLEGARTVQERIELVEWFNAEIKGHVLEVEWA